MYPTQLLQEWATRHAAEDEALALAKSMYAESPAEGRFLAVGAIPTPEYTPVEARVASTVEAMLVAQHGWSPTEAAWEAHRAMCAASWEAAYSAH